MLIRYPPKVSKRKKSERKPVDWPIKALYMYIQKAWHY